MSETPLEMPLLPWRFRIFIRSGGIVRATDNEDVLRFTKQVEKCVFDYVNNTLTITVRQPVEDKGFSEVIKGFKHSSGITLEYFNSSSVDTAVTTIQLAGKMVEHEFVLEYGAEGVAKHRIVMQLD